MNTIRPSRIEPSSHVATQFKLVPMLVRDIEHNGKQMLVDFANAYSELDVELELLINRANTLTDGLRQLIAVLRDTEHAEAIVQLDGRHEMSFDWIRQLDAINTLRGHGAIAETTHAIMRAVGDMVDSHNA